MFEVGGCLYGGRLVYSDVNSEIQSHLSTGKETPSAYEKYDFESTFRRTTQKTEKGRVTCVGSHNRGEVSLGHLLLLCPFPSPEYSPGI